MEIGTKIYLSIPHPCHENWEGMTVTEKGKLCNVCEKEVRDFTKVSKAELLKAVEENNHLCGRVLSTQLDEPVTHSFFRRPFSFLRKIAAFVFAIVGIKLLSISSVNAQTFTLRHPTGDDLKKAGITPVPSTNDSLIQIEGTLRDAKSHELLPFATIRISQNNTTITGTTSNENGRFTISFPNGIVGKDFDIEIIYLGYKPYRIAHIPATSHAYYLDLSMSMSKPAIVGEITKSDFYNTTGRTFNRSEIRQMPW